MLQHTDELMAAIGHLAATVGRLSTSLYFLGVCILAAGSAVGFGLLRVAVAMRGAGRPE